MTIEQVVCGECHTIIIPGADDGIGVESTCINCMSNRMATEWFAGSRFDDTPNTMVLRSTTQHEDVVQVNTKMGNRNVLASRQNDTLGWEVIRWS